MMALPTGKCWCGCGEPTDGFWRPGHDRKAETALLDIVYGDGTTADRLERLGYGPQNSIIKSRDGLRAERSGRDYASANALFNAAENAGYEIKRGAMQVMLFHSGRKVGGWNTKDSHWYISKVIASNHREVMERHGFRWMEKADGRHCWWQIDGEHNTGKFHAVVTALTGVSFRR